MCSKHVEARNKLIIKFSALSWLILGNKPNNNVKSVFYNVVYSISRLSLQFHTFRFSFNIKILFSNFCNRRKSSFVALSKLDFVKSLKI